MRSDLLFLVIPIPVSAILTISTPYSWGDLLLRWRDELVRHLRLSISVRLIIPTAVARIYEIETARAYVAHENQHQQRGWVLRLLATRAATLRENE
jgi:hypothetical protein